ncbi:MAG: hypothetical protein IJ669_01285 [Prevotella sp.]|nr:hypothetical protein [Prevotella sp.]
MKTIRKKAEEYGLLNPDIHYDADGNTYDDVDKPSMDFEAGANYVLEELMKIIPKEDRNLNVAGRALLWRLNERIKQLKSNQ